LVPPALALQEVLLGKNSPSCVTGSNTYLASDHSSNALQNVFVTCDSTQSLNGASLVMLQGYTGKVMVMDDGSMCEQWGPIFSAQNAFQVGPCANATGTLVKIGMSHNLVSPTPQFDVFLPGCHRLVKFEFDSAVGYLYAICAPDTETLAAGQQQPTMFGFRKERGATAVVLLTTDQCSDPVDLVVNHRTGFSASSSALVSCRNSNQVWSVPISNTYTSDPPQTVATVRMTCDQPTQLAINSRDDVLAVRCNDGVHYHIQYSSAHGMLIPSDVCTAVDLALSGEDGVYASCSVPNGAQPLGIFADISSSGAGVTPLTSVMLPKDDVQCDVAPAAQFGTGIVTPYYCASTQEVLLSSPRWLNVDIPSTLPTTAPPAQLKLSESSSYYSYQNVYNLTTAPSGAVQLDPLNGPYQLLSDGGLYTTVVNVSALTSGSTATFTFVAPDALCTGCDQSFLRAHVQLTTEVPTSLSQFTPSQSVYYGSQQVAVVWSLPYWPASATGSVTLTGQLQAVSLSSEPLPLPTMTLNSTTLSGSISMSLPQTMALSTPAVLNQLTMYQLRIVWQLSGSASTSFLSPDDTVLVFRNRTTIHIGQPKQKQYVANLGYTSDSLHVSLDEPVQQTSTGFSATTKCDDAFNRQTTTTFKATRTVLDQTYRWYAPDTETTTCYILYQLSGTLNLQYTLSIDSSDSFQASDLKQLTVLGWTNGPLFPGENLTMQWMPDPNPTTWNSFDIFPRINAWVYYDAYIHVPYGTTGPIPYTVTMPDFGDRATNFTMEPGCSGQYGYTYHVFPEFYWLTVLPQTTLQVTFTTTSRYAPFVVEGNSLLVTINTTVQVMRGLQLSVELSGTGSAFTPLQLDFPVSTDPYTVKTVTVPLPPGSKGNSRIFQLVLTKNDPEPQFVLPEPFDLVVLVDGPRLIVSGVPTTPVYYGSDIPIMCKTSESMDIDAVISMYVSYGGTSDRGYVTNTIHVHAGGDATFWIDLPYYSGQSGVETITFTIDPTTSIFKMPLPINFTVLPQFPITLSAPEALPLGGPTVGFNLSMQDQPDAPLNVTCELIYGPGTFVTSTVTLTKPGTVVNAFYFTPPSNYSLRYTQFRCTLQGDPNDTLRFSAPTAKIVYFTWTYPELEQLESSIWSKSIYVTPTRSIPTGGATLTISVHAVSGLVTADLSTSQLVYEQYRSSSESFKIRPYGTGILMVIFTCNDVPEYWTLPPPLKISVVNGPQQQLFSLIGALPTTLTAGADGSVLKLQPLLPVLEQDGLTVSILASGLLVTPPQLSWTTGSSDARSFTLSAPSNAPAGVAHVQFTLNGGASYPLPSEFSVSVQSSSDPPPTPSPTPVGPGVKPSEVRVQISFTLSLSVYDVLPQWQTEFKQLLASSDVLDLPLSRLLIDSVIAIDSGSSRVTLQILASGSESNTEPTAEDAANDFLAQFDDSASMLRTSSIMTSAGSSAAVVSLVQCVDGSWKQVCKDEVDGGSGSDSDSARSRDIAISVVVTAVGMALLVGGFMHWYHGRKLSKNGAHLHETKDSAKGITSTHPGVTYATPSDPSGIPMSPLVRPPPPPPLPGSVSIFPAANAPASPSAQV